MLDVIQGTGSPNYLGAPYDVKVYTIGGTEYAFTTGSQDDAFSIFDVSDPSNITHVASRTSNGPPYYLEGANKLDVYTIGATEYLFVVASNDHALTIWDVSDPSNPSLTKALTGISAPNYLNYPYSVKVYEVNGTEYAFVACYIGSSLQIFDVSDPVNAAHVGGISGTGSPNYLYYAADVDVYTIGGTEYAFVVSSYSDNALTIFDVSTPATPVHVGVIREGTAGAMGVKVLTIDGTEYAVVVAYTSDALSIIDVSDPTTPDRVGYVNGYGAPYYLGGAQDLALVTIDGIEYACIVSRDVDVFTIYDIHTPSNPYLYTLTVSYQTDSFGVNTYSIGGIDCLFTVDAGTTNGLISWAFCPTFSSSSSSFSSSSFSSSSSSFSSSSFSSSSSSFSSSSSSFSSSSSSFSSSSSSSCIGFEFRDAIQGNGSPNYLNGPQGIKAYTIGGIEYAFVASYTDDALSAFDVSDPGNIVHVSSLTGAGSPNYTGGAFAIDVYTIGGTEYVFLCSRQDPFRFNIYDVSDPSNMFRVWTFGITSSHPYSVKVYTIGGTEYAFMCSYSIGDLMIFDVSDPPNATYVTEIYGPGSPWYMGNPSCVDVYTIGGTEYAFVTGNQSNALTIIDVSTPATPVHTATVYGAGSPYYLNDPFWVRVYTIGGTEYAFIAATADDALTIFDVSTPASPVHVGLIRGVGSPNYLNGIGCVEIDTLYGIPYAFVTSIYDNSLVVIDVSDPSNPTLFDVKTGAPNYLVNAGFVYPYTVSGVMSAFTTAAGTQDALAAFAFCPPSSSSSFSSSSSSHSSSFSSSSFSSCSSSFSSSSFSSSSSSFSSSSFSSSSFISSMSDLGACTWSPSRYDGSVYDGGDAWDGDGDWVNQGSNLRVGSRYISPTVKYQYRSFVKFDLSSIPDDALIGSATLWVYYRYSYGDGVWAAAPDSNDVGNMLADHLEDYGGLDVTDYQRAYERSYNNMIPIDTAPAGWYSRSVTAALVHDHGKHDVPDDSCWRFRQSATLSYAGCTVSNYWFLDSCDDPNPPYLEITLVNSSSSSSSYSSSSSSSSLVLEQESEIGGPGSPYYLNYPRGIKVYDIPGASEHAFICSGADDALVIYDVSDPSTPAIAGYISGTGSPNYLEGAEAVDVYTIGGTEYAFVASFTDQAFSIFDVSDPTSPSLVSSVQGAGSPYYLNQVHDVKVHEIDGTEYAFLVSRQDYALIAFDVSTPGSPVLKAVVNGSESPYYLYTANSLEVREIDGSHYAFIVGDWADRLTIYDVSDVVNGNLTYTARISGAGSPNYIDYPFNLDVVEIYQTWYAILACRGNTDQASITIINVDDPSNPTYTSSIRDTVNPNWKLTGLLDVEVHEINGVYYVAGVGNDDDSITIFNISNPSSPWHLAEFNGSGSPYYLGGPVEVDWHTIGGSHYAFVTAGQDDKLTIFNFHPGDSSSTSSSSSSWSSSSSSSS